ncbi:MAG: T9SS type A sorting domain-containing protein, partial [Salibacteraceae bacterium]|nr:T9SS type A sorting domain-containing protein [Salibacteraceae bacterium]
ANGNGLQFAWDNASTLNVSNAKTVIASPTTTTTYSVTATLNACNTVATTTIEVQDAPLMTVTESTNGAAICLDSFATINTVCDSCDYYIYNFPNSTVQTTNATQIVSPNVVGAVNIIVNGVGGNGCRAIENVTINVDDCFNGTPFAVQELTAADLVLVQRNQQIQVSTPVRINAVDVYNILGSRVASIAGVASNSASIDASSLSSGIYIVMVKSENGEVTKKLYLN